MKLLKHQITVGASSGFIKVVLENPEDIWHAYNLIAVGDKLQSTTMRKVDVGGGGQSEKMKLTLEVEVEAIEFDASASVLRARGKTVTENEFVRVGSYHTLEIDLQRAFTLTKQRWDSFDLDIIKEATNPASSADLAAIMMQEGLAHVCLVGGSVTTVAAKIESSIPRKRGPAIAGYDKALDKFFEHVLQAILRHIDFGVVTCLIIASPGFTKDQFLEYTFLEAERRSLRDIIENKAKILLAHSSSGHKHALKEVFSAPEVMARIKDTKAAKEVRAIEEFFHMFNTDSSRAFYGPGHVEAANERVAIQTLLISDSLFRNADVVARRKYVNLTESVRENGGTVHVFSSEHVSGEQLNQMTGIAAILRFPLPDVEDMDL